MNETEQQHDLVIIGGGMVGAALALACRGQGLKIAVIDGQPPQRDWPEGEVDLRVSAISRASQRLLERLGAWARIKELGASVYREMHVWDALGGASIHFDSADIGEPDLGHIVENRVTRLALWEQLEAAGDVDLYCPARIASMDRIEIAGASTGGYRVSLDDGRVLEPRLLVGADGRDSWVRGRLGIATSGWDYGQRAIVANVEPGRWHQETAWQRFLPTGPLAFLPLSDGRCSIVWSAEDRRAEALLALDDAAFIAELEQAFQEKLGPVLSIGPRAAFPLRLQHAQHYVLPGAALVGDAAHAIHPLAGQGVNLGFQDAAALAEVVLQAQTKGRDIGALSTLRRYERARRGANMTMLGAMDVFKRLFSNRLPPLVAIRNLGLFTANRLQPVKRAFMTRALGIGGLSH